MFLSDLDPEVLRVLTQRRVVDYLRSRRGAALANGDYEIEVVEGRSSELVLPEKPEGVKLTIPPRQTLWGRIEFALYVAPAAGRRRRVSVVGRAGTSILDDLAELEESRVLPGTATRSPGESSSSHSSRPQDAERSSEIAQPSRCSWRRSRRSNRQWPRRSNESLER